MSDRDALTRQNIAELRALLEDALKLCAWSHEFKAKVQGGLDMLCDMALRSLASETTQVSTPGCHIIPKCDHWCGLSRCLYDAAAAPTPSAVEEVEQFSPLLAKHSYEELYAKALSLARRLDEAQEQGKVARANWYHWMIQCADAEARLLATSPPAAP